MNNEFKGQYSLIQLGEVIGEAMVFADGAVSYYFYRNPLQTFKSNVDHMRHKYSLVRKIFEA